jgi:SAM-dependent methyltransferase
MPKTMIKSLIGYNRVQLLRKASEARCAEVLSGDTFHPVSDAEVRRHVIDLNDRIDELTPAQQEAWFHSESNALRLARFKYRLWDTLRLVREETGEKKPKNILDVGAGTGLFLRTLGGGTGLDVDEGCVLEMKRHGLTSIHLTTDQLPFANKQFDYSCFLECFEHLENPIAILREIVRVTKKKIFITIPYVPHSRIGDKDTHGRKRDANYHFFELSASDFQKVCERIGLKILKKSFMVPYSAQGLPLRFRVLNHMMPGKLFKPEWVFFSLECS